MKLYKDTNYNALILLVYQLNNHNVCWGAKKRNHVMLAVGAKVPRNFRSRDESTWERKFHDSIWDCMVRQRWKFHFPTSHAWRRPRSSPVYPDVRACLRKTAHKTLWTCATGPNQSGEPNHGWLRSLTQSWWQKMDRTGGKLPRPGS